MAIDWEAAKSGKRPLRRADGYPCRFLEKLEGLRGAYAAAVAIRGNEYVHDYTVDGRFMNDPSNPDYCLIQEPEVIEFKRWVNVYGDRIGGSYVTRQMSDVYEDSCRIAAVPIIVRITGNKIVIHGESEPEFENER